MSFFIVGLGRIGRHLLRELSDKCDSDFYAYDLNQNLDNIAYLLNFDSVYGLREERFVVTSGGLIDTNRGIKINFSKPQAVPSEVVAIDSTGSDAALKQLVDIDAVKRVYVTNANKSAEVQQFIVANYSPQSDARVISVSICDTTAITPVVEALDRRYGVRSGHVTTLHPWLNYQNLSDSSVISTSIPENYWHDFALGRKSTEALIPKTTSAIAAMSHVAPELASRLTSWSYRVPTPVVSSALINLSLSEFNCDLSSVVDLLTSTQGVVIGGAHRISSDYIGLEASCAVDLASLTINNDTLFLSLWYDNEKGYVSQILKYIWANEGLV